MKFFYLSILALFISASITLSNAGIDSPGTASMPLSDSDWPWWRGPDRNGHGK
ncbi:MAG: hypothetical protein HOL92_14460, partial [Opitutales bacterium]|nr:hypothetical protein [Opitutales bacterium]